MPTNTSGKTKLIIIGGAPATGKSTTVARLKEACDFEVVSWDKMKESLWDTCGYADKDFSRGLSECVFPVFQKMVEMHLDQGHDVIVDSTFVWPEDEKWINEYAKKYKAEIIQLWHTSDPRVARQRFIDRAKSGERHPGHNDTVEAVLEEFEKRYWNRSFTIPLPLSGKTMIVESTDLESVDYPAIIKFVCE